MEREGEMERRREGEMEKRRERGKKGKRSRETKRGERGVAACEREGVALVLVILFVEREATCATPRVTLARGRFCVQSF